MSICSGSTMISFQSRHVEHIQCCLGDGLLHEGAVLYIRLQFQLFVPKHVLFTICSKAYLEFEMSTWPSVRLTVIDSMRETENLSCYISRGLIIFCEDFFGFRASILWSFVLWFIGQATKDIMYLWRILNFSDIIKERCPILSCEDSTLIYEHLF